MSLPPLRYVKEGEPAPYRRAREEEPARARAAARFVRDLLAHGWTYRHHKPDAEEPCHVVHFDLIRGGVLIHKLAGASESLTSAIVALWIHATRHKSTIVDKARRP